MDPSRLVHSHPRETESHPILSIQESKMKFVILGEWAARFRGREFEDRSEAVEAVEVELEWTGAGRHAKRTGDSWVLEGVVLAEVLSISAWNKALARAYSKVAV